MGYYLLEHRNPNAVGGFHGYEGRRKEVRIVVIHTTQNRFDTIGPDTGAENVAGYLSRTTRQASYHDIVDSDSWVKCLPWSYTAFGARSYNSDAIHIAFAGDAHEWHALSDEQIDKRLRRAASVVRSALAYSRLPAERLSDVRARNDGRGICGHYQLDPDRRSDPGDDFPWRRFMALIDQPEAENMEWLNKWSKWARELGRKYGTEHTDPKRKVADLSVEEFIALQDRIINRGR